MVCNRTGCASSSCPTTRASSTNCATSSGSMSIRPHTPSSCRSMKRARFRRLIDRAMQRHRHQEFIRFLNVIEKQVPAGKTIHAIVDNYAAHKHPNVRRWLERHPRWTLHFTPTSASWLNAVEGFFATLTKRRLKRGVFRSVVDLQAAINRFLEDHNQQSQPFTWTADPDKIIAAVRRGHQALDSVHERWLRTSPP